MSGGRVRREDGVVISIITAVLNRPGPLVRTVESVLAQGRKSVEHIVVDGGSSDETPAVLKHYSAQGVRCLSESDDGIYDALNKGIRHARGSHVCVLHADDVYLPGAVDVMLDHINRDPCAIWYADSRLGDRICHAPEVLTPAIRLYNLGIAHQSLVTPLVAFDKTAAYRRDFRIVSDYLWMRDAYEAGFRFRKMPGCHVLLDDGGLSSGQTDETRRLFEREVAARTRLYYPFVPGPILQAIYRHRTIDASAQVRAWAAGMEASGESTGIDSWDEFRAALDDYLERVSTTRSKL